MDRAFVAIQSIISVCGSQQDHPFAASWYLIVGEEARSFLATLELARKGLFEQATSWPPRPDFSVLLDSLNATVREADEFFRRVQDTERRKAENAASDDQENFQGDAMVGPTVELITT